MSKMQPEKEVQKIQLVDLQSDFYRLEFLVKQESAKITKEMEVSIQAGELVGLLYDALYKSYADPNEETLKSLNKLCVRLVFCMYAEDAGLFGKKDMFHDYLVDVEPRKMRGAIKDLFRILNTPDDQRDPDEDEDLLAFPYVNGGLFEDDDISIPQFNDELKELLLERASNDFDWSDISPTIFGAIFESTLNPETRRSGGMHYTSIENIHKVIDPLFLNDLKKELEECKAKSNVGGARTKALQKFQEKLAGLCFLDPAAGSGNFLTESYTSLRRLENEVLRELKNDFSSGQITFGFVQCEDMLDIKVSIQQFYGIEINDFAVTVAKTALWIAEAQMMKETMSFTDISTHFLPLKTYVNIIEGNALRINWNDVLSIDKCSFIMGNPPFVGYSLQNRDQKNDITSVYVDENGKPYSTAGEIDYVAGWYFKASQYIKKSNVRVAFVSTNSITQGEQVANVWRPLYQRFNIHIDFAYRTFIWDSEANIKAHVHCVIVGFSTIKHASRPRLFSGNQSQNVNNINAYLLNAPDIFIDTRSKPICTVPEMTNGNKPTDGGFLLLSPEDRKEMILKEPECEKFIRRLYGAVEYINNKERYCIWLQGISPAEYRFCSQIMDRITKVREFRLASPKGATVKSADYPMLFQQIRQPETNYIIVPRVSSENRRYIPIGFMSPDVIVTDSVQFIPNADLYEFGVLTSNVHMAWMRAICGRLKSDYRYSAKIVYNNFPWPDVNEDQHNRISMTAKAILDARSLYPDSSLADLYDPRTMPLELQKAHTQNDIAVMKAYGFNIREMSEADCVAELMKQYQQLTNRSSR